jgi:hypothetical protein
MLTKGKNQMTRVTYIDVLNAEAAVRKAAENNDAAFFAAVRHLEDVVVAHAAANAANPADCTD